MASEKGLTVDYLPLAAQDARSWQDVLGVATFESTLPPVTRVSVRSPATSALAADIALAEVGTPLLDSDRAICEVWRTGQKIESGRRGSICYRRSESLLFGALSLTETEALQSSERDDRSPLHATTQLAYRDIYATLDELGYTHLARIWNYLPQINEDTHGLERYRQFNRGRREALIASRRELTGSVPAACALGSTPGSPLVIYFLASRTPPRVIENPRQVSAYEYPPQYGPKPVFSRASLLQEATSERLFISGTASIVGHETVHIGDVAAQTRETLANIEALLSEANRVSDLSRFDPRALAYKVYVRNGADLPIIQSQLHSALGSDIQAIYLQADICRQDLLVEIEATAQSGLIIGGR